MAQFDVHRNTGKHRKDINASDFQTKPEQRDIQFRHTFAANPQHELSWGAELGRMEKTNTLVQENFFHIGTGIVPSDRLAQHDQDRSRDLWLGFNAYPTQQLGTLPVYRFFNTTGQAYFYTIDESEKNNVIQNYPAFTYQGVAFYAYPAQQTDTLPLYRFQNTRASAHFFTIYQSERDAVMQNYNWFLYEGVSFYVYLRQSTN